MITSPPRLFSAAKHGYHFLDLILQNNYIRVLQDLVFGVISLNSSFSFLNGFLLFTVVSEPGSSGGPGRGLDVNRFPAPAIAAEEADDGASLSSPNSTVSSFQMDFCVRNGGRTKRDLEVDNERASSRASDDEENGSTRKKLRLSKEQSAFLEESFKEHSTLNPVSPTFKKLVLLCQSLDTLLWLHESVEIRSVGHLFFFL